MTFRISPVWWPGLVAASPLVGPLLLLRNRRFRANRDRATDVNEARIREADKLPLPELDSLQISVLVEQEAAPGALHDAGVSYLVKTDRGAVLFDVGFGPATRTLAHNAKMLGHTLDDVDALVISHLHPDHMGGVPAFRRRSVAVPGDLGPPDNKLCFLPDKAEAEGFDPRVVTKPQMIAAGIGTTGPLARSLFFLGWTEEQALIAKCKDKGLVVITGCGHQTASLLLQMVRRLSDEPIHTIVGGLHLPVTHGRGGPPGIEPQCILGTGMPPWSRITDDDVTETIEVINGAGTRVLHFSAHDSCDHAIERLRQELHAEVHVLRAGTSFSV